MEISNVLVTIPLNQILESIICHRTFSDLSNGLLTAMLYGLAAKRCGRQFILALSVLGGTLAAGFVIFICSFPAVFSPRLVWLSSAFSFVGGGVPVFTGMSFALLSDAVDESQRSTTFFYMNATTIGSQVVGGLLAFVLMRMSAWMCIYSGVSFAAIATLTAFSLPVKTDNYKSLSVEGTASHGAPPTLRGQLKQVLEAVIWFTRGNLVSISLLSTLLTTTLGRSAPDILLQYVTKRYGWSWSDASLLLSIHWFLTFGLLAVILPSTTQFLIQVKGLPTQRTDLLLARFSVFFASTGAFSIGVSSNIPFMTAGLGLFTFSYAYPMLARSLLASVIDKDHTDVMYTTIGMFEAFGAVIAGPLLSASFRQGLKWGTDWLGLPFLVTGVLFGSAAILLCAIRLPGRVGTAI
ncbi:hypothetical protein LMH87_005348 [Akanthomyces muscarius]|uniref:MFS transporter n=1 Tax=Akanthomyces muscarius TaxID=2231603 RepID=A0A9W8UQH6_AKAMU|nr:hypothetical protein LMH87_005348 [Akanthomyces muscarius]KAJ4163631.1 hypothetical protein LMH87_005348 [Akanthomyces muscarius]